MIPSRITIGVLLFFLPLIGLWGCGSRFPTAPVSGTVTFDGKPLVDATVCFEPIAKTEDGVAGVISIGKTDKNGHFTLKTIEGEPGAVIGVHRIRITAAHKKSKVETDEMMAPKEIIPQQYNVETNLSFTVSDGGSQEADFELSSN